MVTNEKLELYDNLISYRDGKIALLDNAEVYSIVANLPIVRELQNKVSALRTEISAMQEMKRFLESDADSFCTMWKNFKSLTKE